MKYEAKQKKHRAPAPVLSCVLLLDVVPGEGWIDFSAQLGLGGGLLPAPGRYLDNLWGEEAQPRYGTLPLVYEPPGSIYAHCYRVL